MAKSKYDEYIKPKLILIEGWARDGLTIEQICHNLDISKTTFYKYMEEHSELSERLKKGKEVIDIEVENALLKRALGYKYTEVTKEPIGGKMQVTKEVTKEVQPDTTAQIFWLKNRKPADWRDKKDIEHSGGLDIKQTYENMSEDELLELAKRYEKINKST